MRGVPKIINDMLDQEAFLSLEDERRYLNDAKSEDKVKAKIATDKLVLSHARLVLKLVMKKTHYLSHNSKDDLREDLLQEGNLVLYQAIKNFDLNRVSDTGKPIRFATMATYWIKQALDTYLAAEKFPVKMPTKSNKTRFLIYHFVRLRDEVMREYPNISYNNMLKMVATKANISGLHIQKILNIIDQPVIELNRDTYRDYDDSPTNQDYLIDPDAEKAFDNVEHAIDSEVLKDAIANAVRSLNERERVIFERRWLTEVDDDEKNTLAVLSAEWGISRERVRQIEVKAFGKVKQVVLANKHQRKQLMAYLD